MRVRLKKDWTNFRAGEVVNLSVGLARSLIRKGIAEEDKVIPPLERK